MVNRELRWNLECKEMIRRYLKDYVREGGAVLLTSHEMEELAVCSKLYVLSQSNLKEVPLGLTAEELIKPFAISSRVKCPQCVRL